MPTLFPQMFQHKLAPSGIEVGHSSKSSLPLDPFAPVIGSTGFMLDSTITVPSQGGPSPTTVRMWAKFFASRDPSLPSVTIPAEWMDFFTMLLLKESSNEWASQFL